MAKKFSPGEYIGRPPDSDESVEVPMVLTHLYDDEDHSIIVATDGAYRENGSHNARAALEVFFRKSSHWNKSELLPQSDATSQRAELCAVLRTLQFLQTSIAHEWHSSVTTGKNLNRVIIKSDSDYTVRSMTEYIFKWVDNNYTNARGQPVQNQDLFKQIADLIQQLDQEKNLKVLFWKVGQEHNQDADRLANAALDTANTPTWDHRQSDEDEVKDYDSERVWRWHSRLGHIALNMLKHAVNNSRGIDVTE